MMRSFEGGSLALEDLPVAAEMRLGRNIASERLASITGRRGFLKASIATTTVVGLWMVGAFRGTPRAFATINYPPYYELPGSTAGGSCTGTPNGSPNCYGTVDAYISNNFCATCGEALTDPSEEWNQYIYNGSRGIPGVLYQDQGINGCSGDYDAWRHSVSTTCGYCGTTEWRCHDGYKTDSGGMHGTRCHGLAKCGSTQTDPTPTSC